MCQVSNAGEFEDQVFHADFTNIKISMTINPQGMSAVMSIGRSPGYDKLRHQPPLWTEDAHAAALRDEHGTIGIDK